MKGRWVGMSMSGIREYAFKIRSEDNLLCRFTQEHASVRIVLDLLRPASDARVEKAVVTILAPRMIRQRFLSGEFGRKYGSYEVLSEAEEYASVEISTAILSYYQQHDPIQLTLQMLGPETIFQPVVVEGGYITISVLSPNPDRLQAFNEFTSHMRRVVPADDFKLLHTGEYQPEARWNQRTHLTPRQEEVMRMAVAMGYYSEPRACTLEDLAQAFGISKAAVHKRLQLAENTLMRNAFDGP